MSKMFDSRERRCPVCGKRFMCNPDRWGWKARIDSAERPVCSYGCMRRIEKERLERKERQRQEQEAYSAQRREAAEKRTRNMQIGRCRQLIAEYERRVTKPAGKERKPSVIEDNRKRLEKQRQRLRELEGENDEDVQVLQVG